MNPPRDDQPLLTLLFVVLIGAGVPLLITAFVLTARWLVGS